MYEPVKWVFVGIWMVTAVAAAGHALINKRDSRAALGWIVVSLTVPMAGSLLYFFFGVNRIRTRAKTFPGLGSSPDRQPSAIAARVELPLEFSELAGISGAVSNFDLTTGNKIEILHNGEQTYPAMLWEILQRGVRVFLQPPPFVHTKLFLVDGHYVQVGAANMDPRSLRLNFELVVEIYDRDFATTIDRHFEAVRKRSREVTLEEVDGRPLPIRVRDGLAWLLSPYL